MSPWPNNSWFCYTADAANRLIGVAVAWLIVPMVVLKFSIVLLRYVFGIGALSLQEIVLYMHAAVFLLAAGYTLLKDEHPRVDVLYQGFTVRGRAIANMLGVVLFLLPMCLSIAYFSWDYVIASWRIFEGSTETSGLRGVFLLKSLILVFAALLAIQGLAIGCRAIGALRYREANESGG